jgi:ASC-1-like (ASCH) protein
MEHNLKIEDAHLQRLLTGEKKAEIRLNDRDFQLGDVLKFKEYKYDTNILVYHTFRITHIHSGLGMAFNYVVLSVEKIS